MGDDLKLAQHLDDLALKSLRIHVKKGFFNFMENKFSSNFERELSNSSVDWEGDLHNVDKITDFPLRFIFNMKQ